LTRCAAQLWKYVSQFATFCDQIVNQSREVRDAIDHATNAQNRERVISDSEDPEPERDIFIATHFARAGEEIRHTFVKIADGVRRRRRTIAEDSHKRSLGDPVRPQKQPPLLVRLPAPNGGQPVKTVPAGMAPKIAAATQDPLMRTVIAGPEKVNADESPSERAIKEACAKFRRYGVPGQSHRIKLMKTFREWRNQKIAKVRPLHVVAFNTACNDIDFILAEKILIAKRVREIQRLFRQARKSLDVF
jgi:hypothetical protein